MASGTGSRDPIRGAVRARCCVVATEARGGSSLCRLREVRLGRLEILLLRTRVGGLRGSNLSSAASTAKAEPESFPLTFANILPAASAISTALSGIPDHDSIELQRSTPRKGLSRAAGSTKREERSGKTSGAPDSDPELSDCEVDHLTRVAGRLCCRVRHRDADAVPQAERRPPHQQKSLS